MSFDDAMKKAQAILNELVASLDKLQWTVLEGPVGMPGDAKFYQGLGEDWVVTVAAYRRPGALAALMPHPEYGYDGTCAKDATLVRLPREVAEKVFLHAKATVGG